MEKLIAKDGLRRRPNKIRYSFIATSENNVHTGFSYWGLETTLRKHGVNKLFVVDLLKKKVIEVKEPITDFMKRWRNNYNNTAWDYENDIKTDADVPNVGL